MSTNDIAIYRFFLLRPILKQSLRFVFHLGGPRNDGTVGFLGKPHPIGIPVIASVC